MIHIHALESMPVGFVVLVDVASEDERSAGLLGSHVAMAQYVEQYA